MLSNEFAAAFILYHVQQLGSGCLAACTVLFALRVGLCWRRTWVWFVFLDAFLREQRDKPVALNNVSTP